MSITGLTGQNKNKEMDESSEKNDKPHRLPALPAMFENVCHLIEACSNLRFMKISCIG